MSVLVVGDDEHKLEAVSPIDRPWETVKGRTMIRLRMAMGDGKLTPCGNINWTLGVARGKITYSAENNICAKEPS
jgi:hypothetical protein